MADEDVTYHGTYVRTYEHVYRTYRGTPCTYTCTIGRATYLRVVWLALLPTSELAEHGEG